MNESQTKGLAEKIVPLVCASIGIAGLLLNLASAYIASSDAVLGVLVLGSIGMILVGYLPALKKWPGRQWTTRIMNVSMLGFVVYCFCTIGSDAG